MYRKYFVAFGLSVLLILEGCSDNKLTKTQIQARMNYIHGDATECMMDRFFTYKQNWKKIDAESGNHGIDGLFIKISGEKVSAVLVAESKYNTSRLGSIKKGTIRQMSKMWIVEKLKEAKPANPDFEKFDQIISLVKKGRYRAMLFRLKPLKGTMFKILLSKIKNIQNGKDVILKKVREVVIDGDHPKNAFHADMLEAYRMCAKRTRERWF